MFTDTNSMLCAEALSRIFEATQMKNLTPRLGELAMPVLVINGELDGTLPRSRAMSQQIRNAVHRVIPGAGHACCIEQPALFDEIVCDFLTKHKFLP
jgi:pimeloyl-ACP methyl ester carboxylesterase